MPDRSYLQWPFFENRHRELARRIDDWARQELSDETSELELDVDETCRGLLARLAEGDWLAHCVADPQPCGQPRLDVRALCLLREHLARHSALADFVLAMQGLGSGPISLFGSAELRRRYLPGVREGRLIAAFALSEPDAGSDVAALATTAARDGERYVLNGEKTWISNGGIAHFYVVFARTGEGPGTKGLSAFVVDADTPGLEVAERIRVMAPHPLARLVFRDCRVDEARRVGAAGDGFGIAMGTLDVFRATVGAAALGLARRALDEALRHASSRELYGAKLADMQLTRARLADMATAIDAAALLVYRAAWTRDCVAGRVTREAAMAKLFATEAAQEVIDSALQLFGGLGVRSGMAVEALYREIRALRIYEGASEVQQQIIARQLLRTERERAPGR